MAYHNGEIDIEDIDLDTDDIVYLLSGLHMSLFVKALRRLDRDELQHIADATQQALNNTISSDDNLILGAEWHEVERWIETENIQELSNWLQSELAQKRPKPKLRETVQ